MVHKTFFSLTFLPYSLYFLLHFLFLPFPSTFLSWKKERSFLMKLEMPAGAKKGGKKGESERGKTKLQ